MKLQPVFRSLLTITGTVCLATSHTQASTLYWDGGTINIVSDGNGASAGGAGTWNSSLLNWDIGASPHVAWTSGDYAVMAGTGATVTVGSGIVTSGIDFTVNSYVLDATSNGLGFTSGSNQIRIAGNNFGATINGAISGAGSMNFQSIHNASTGFNPTPLINFGGTSTGGWEGATTITRGVSVNLQDNNQALNSTSGITLNGGMIRLTNTDATSITNNRVNDDAAIDITGGGGIRIANTAGAGRVYSENIGEVTLNSGYSKFTFTTNQSGGSGNSQTLTLAGLTRNGHSVISLAAATATSGITVTGATQTGAGQIIGAWAISGNGNTDDDYAIYNASGQIANRAATANNNETTWSTAWSNTANINTTATWTLSADREMNTLRTQTATAFSVGDYQLKTYGILVANGNGATINAGTGSITIADDNGSQALYLISGNTGGAGTIINAPFRDNGSNKLTLVLSGGNGSQLTLNGNSDYTGGTVIARAAVVNSATSGMSNLNIGHANALGASTNYLKFDSGSLNLNTHNVVVGEFSGEASSYIAASAGGTLTVGTNTTSASDTEFKGQLNSGQLVKNGDGRLTLSGHNAAAATAAQYTVNSGTLQFVKNYSFFGSNAALATNTGNWTKGRTIVNSGATLAFNVGGTEEFTAAHINTIMTNLGGSNATGTEGFQAGSRLGLDTTNAVGGTFTQGNAIANSSGAGGGAIGLTKLGTGTLALDKINTYSGQTTVAGGTLALIGTGSIANSSTIQINSSTTLDVTGLTGNFTLGSSQTLSGGGTILATGKTVTVNGTVSAGNSPGTITQSGGTYQLGANGNMNWQIHNAAGAAGVGYDTVSLTNGAVLDLSLLSQANPYNINLWSLSGIGPDVNGDATNFDSNQNYTWTLIATATAISGFNQNLFVINDEAINGTSGFSNLFGSGTFSVGLADGNTDLVLNFTAIPEPKAVLLGAIGVLLLLRRRR